MSNRKREVLNCAFCAVKGQASLLQEKESRQRLQSALLLYLALPVLYFVVARASLLLATLNANTSPFWPPAAVGIGAALVFGRKSFIPIFFSASLTNWAVGTPIWISVLIGVGNSLEGLLGAWLISRLREWKAFDGFQDAISVILAVPVASLIGAGVGVSALVGGGLVSPGNSLSAFVTWWVGDSIGALVFVPWILDLKSEERRQGTGWQFPLALALVAIHFALTLPFRDSFVLNYLAFPLLLVAARGGRFSILSFTATFSVVSAIAVRMGYGLYQSESVNTNLVNLQLLVCALQITALFVSELKLQSNLRRFALPMMAGWLVTAILFQKLHREAHQKTEDRFQNIADLAKAAVEDEFKHAEVMLRGGAAMIRSGGGDVLPTEWKEYFEGLNFDSVVGGIRGFGVVYSVPAAKMREFEFRQKREGNNCFRYHPVPNQSKPMDVSYMITHIQPSERNKGACGLDLASEVSRKSAADRALATGQLEMTDSIQLVQDNKARSGFLLYFPLAPREHESLLAQKAAPRWVYAPFVAEEMLQSALKRRDLQEANFIFQMKLNPNLYTRREVPDLDGGRHAERLIQVGSQQLRMIVRANSFFSTQEDLTATWVALVGSMMTILLTAFFASLQTLNERATLLAEQKTAALEKAHQDLEKERQIALRTAKLASLGEMSAGIAHEINNPLAIISGSLNLMKKNHQNEVVFLEKLGVAEAAVFRIQKIVKSLKKFSRTSEQRHFQVESLRAILSDVLVLLEPKSKKHGVRVNFEGEDVNLLCDLVEIEQVMVNVIGNAIDAAKNSFEKCVDVKLFVTDTDFVVQVFDSGDGIPPHLESKLFEPFYTTKPVGEGTGLGLSISKGILDEHGASIQLNRKYYQTCFEIRFPKTSEVNRVA